MHPKPPPPSWAGKRKEQKKSETSKVSKNTAVSFMGIDFINQVDKLFYQALTALELEFDRNYDIVVFDNRKSRSTKVALFKEKGISPVKVTYNYMFLLKGIMYLVNTQGHANNATQAWKLKQEIAKHAIYDSGTAETTMILELYADNLEDTIWFIKNILAGKDEEE